MSTPSADTDSTSPVSSAPRSNPRALRGARRVVYPTPDDVSACQTAGPRWVTGPWAPSPFRSIYARYNCAPRSVYNILDSMTSLPFSADAVPSCPYMATPSSGYSTLRRTTLSPRSCRLSTLIGGRSSCTTSDHVICGRSPQKSANKNGALPVPGPCEHMRTSA
ncbi:hypothetical protein BV20DRAFT_358868 [Pilatotrama ljubarskyi]|nr:hypothetical protein BV20DRAFT_358868 [Pilatotrama ljubarskyi]